MNHDEEKYEREETDHIHRSATGIEKDNGEIRVTAVGSSTGKALKMAKDGKVSPSFSPSRPFL